MNAIDDTERETLLITGASSGLGYAIAAEALKRGHRVVGTARNIEKAAIGHPEFIQAGGKWLQIDLTDQDTQNVVGEVFERENVTVLINNAGYGLYRALEYMSESEIRAQFETNVFGTLKVIKGAIPYFRTKKRGTIVTMSSGIMYLASKFALEAISEGLQLQLRPFSIRLLILEPGLFRTNWLVGSFEIPERGLSEGYVGTTIDEGLTMYATMHGSQDGDPKKAAKIVIDVITGVGFGSDEKVRSCLRLPLGIDAMEKAREYVKTLTEELDSIEVIARSTSFTQC